MEVITTYGFCTTKSASVKQADGKAKASTAAAEADPGNKKKAKQAAIAQANAAKIKSNDDALKFSKRHAKGKIIGPVFKPAATAGQSARTRANNLNKSARNAAKGEKPTAPKV